MTAHRRDSHRAPSILRQLAGMLLALKRALAILDLGCGTGRQHGVRRPLPA
jgi:predicted TPR repeat methyltransferase